MSRWRFEMRANEFNEQVTSTLEPALLNVGFVRKGSDFVRQREESQLVLLRFGGSKFASLRQFTRFMLCFRHTFLRDLDEAVPVSHPKNGHAYPFRIQPSSLTSLSVIDRFYQFKLNADSKDYDEIEYGNLRDAKPRLQRIGDSVAAKGLEWATIFSEDFALGLLTKYGADAWCEKLWIQDYLARKQKSLA